LKIHKLCGPEDQQNLKLRLTKDLVSMVSWKLDLHEMKFHLSDNTLTLYPGLNRLDYDFPGILDKYAQPEDLDYIHEAFAEGIENGILKDLEFRIRLGEMGVRHLRAEGKKFDIPGENLYMLGVFQDITEWRLAEQEALNKVVFLDTLLNTIDSPIYYKNSDFLYEHYNKPFLNYLGLSDADVLGHTIQELCPPEISEQHRQSDLRLEKEKIQQTYQSKALYHDGTEHDVLVTKSVVLDDLGNFKGLVGYIRDISDQIQMEAKLKRTAKMKDLVLEINHAILEKTEINAFFDVILEKTLETMESADFGSILVLGDDQNLTIAASRGYLGDDVKSFVIPLEDCFQWKATQGNLTSTIIINDIDTFENNKHLDNDKRQIIRSSISSPLILDGKLMGFLIIDSVENNTFTKEDEYLMEYLRGQLLNAISRFKLYENVVYISEHDPQTGLYSRRYLETAFSAVREKGLRYGEDFLLAVFDLDQLKHVNDSFGHLAGDALISSFAKTLKSMLRVSDILARTGGDEFAGILFHAASSQVEAKMESLQQYLNAHPLVFNGTEIRCSFSYGLSVFPDEGVTYDELLGAADSRMYNNKQKKRQFSIFE
jgi:diguanylate cyclase (GGDEF)-like protein/PAS domain S-box-containing protein